jgi:hypothetical protein
VAGAIGHLASRPEALAFLRADPGGVERPISFESLVMRFVPRSPA